MPRLACQPSISDRLPGQLRLMYYFTDPNRFVGVDPWDRSIELCHLAGLGDNFRQSDYLPTSLPVGEQTFDFIYAFSVFTHLSERATRQALNTLHQYMSRDGVLIITIRPIEYWNAGHSNDANLPVLLDQHRNRGFAFLPHNRDTVDGDITYGDTSIAPQWLAAEFPNWQIVGLDRSLDDPYQIYAILRPAAGLHVDNSGRTTNSSMEEEPDGQSGDSKRNGSNPKVKRINFLQTARNFLLRTPKETQVNTTRRINDLFPIDYDPGGEVGRSYLARVKNGFFERYYNGELVLDIGYRGGSNAEGRTIVPHAIGVDMDYPGYDGTHLPFENSSIDCVSSSHCLEHIWFAETAIREWYRVLKIGGFICCMVPHQHLYEKRRFPPSRYNPDHKRFLTPGSLLTLFENALDINSFRVRHLRDIDDGFDYSISPDQHSKGCYEIELVIEKIERPNWTLI